MTILDLEAKVAKRIEKAIGNLQLKNKKGEYQEVKVVRGILPPENIMKKKDTSYEEFPFIMVRFHRLNEDNEAIAEFKIIIGVCVEDEDGKNRQEAWKEENYQEGHHDLLTCISKIRQNFLRSTNLEGALIKKPFKAEIFLEQPFPYMYAEINLQVMLNIIDSTDYID